MPSYVWLRMLWGPWPPGPMMYTHTTQEGKPSTHTTQEGKLSTHTIQEGNLSTHTIQGGSHLHTQYSER